MAGYLVIAITLLLILGSVVAVALDQWLRGHEQAAYSLRDDHKHE